MKILCVLNCLIMKYRYSRIIPVSLFLVGALTLLSCGKEKKEEAGLEFNQQHFEQLISTKPDHYKNYVIIPGSGCQGCISQAEQFVIDNALRYKEERIHIFTNMVSKKLLKLRLGPEVANLPNIIYDSLDLLHYRSIYPMFVEKGPEGDLTTSELRRNDMVLPVK